MRSTNGRHLPALSHLVALEATVRLASVTGAAEELCLTQSAVSKQLTELEAYLGVALLTRRKGAVSATPAGEQYLRTVRRVVAELEEATLDVLSGGAAAARLAIAVPDAIARHWLQPRLARFAEAHPDIRAGILAGPGPVDLQAAGVDAAILHCSGPAEGQSGVKAIPLVLFPVCAPRLLAPGESAQAALQRLPLLHQADALPVWTAYLDLVGLPAPKVQRGARYGLLALGLRAARSGMGVALLPDFLTTEDLRAGRLVRLLDTGYATPRAYYLVCLEEARERYAVAAFAAWLVGEASGERPAVPALHSLSLAP